MPFIGPQPQTYILDMECSTVHDCARPLLQSVPVHVVAHVTVSGAGSCCRQERR